MIMLHVSKRSCRVAVGGGHRVRGQPVARHRAIVPFPFTGWWRVPSARVQEAATETSQRAGEHGKLSVFSASYQETNDRF